MKYTRLLLLALVFLQSLAALQADGGTVHLSGKKGNYRITVFTSPTPLRAGPVDVSVFVQDAITGEPVSDARITVRASPREHPEAAIEQRATSDAATNKLFQAVVFDLPASGKWQVTILVEGVRESIEVNFEIDVDEPLPRVWELTAWIGWPVVAILLFFVHHWLVQRKGRGIEAQK